MIKNYLQNCGDRRAKGIGWSSLTYKSSDNLLNDHYNEVYHWLWDFYTNSHPVMSEGTEKENGEITQ